MHKEKEIKKPKVSAAKIEDLKKGKADKMAGGKIIIK